MKRIITAAVLVPLVLLLVFKGSFVVILVATAMVAELAAWEFFSLADRSGAKVPRICAMVAIAILFAAMDRSMDLVVAALLLCSIFLFVVCAFRSPLERVLPDTAYSVFGLIYVGLFLTSIPSLAAEDNGASLLLFLFCVVWSGDVAALYIGRSVGKHKLAPAISPNKTWEGSIASVAGSLLIAAGLFYLGRELGDRGIFAIDYSGPIARWLGLALLMNVAAQVGDLVESAIKRGSGVKDSGSMLPGHGGILDRIDALMLAAPVLWIAQLAQKIFASR
jgi:phosphatidate cytidylyltransferase